MKRVGNLNGKTIVETSDLNALKKNEVAKENVGNGFILKERQGNSINEVTNNEFIKPQVVKDLFCGKSVNDPHALDAFDFSLVDDNFTNPFKLEGDIHLKGLNSIKSLKKLMLTNKQSNSVNSITVDGLESLTLINYIGFSGCTSYKLIGVKKPLSLGNAFNLNGYNPVSESEIHINSDTEMIGDDVVITDLTNAFSSFKFKDKKIHLKNLKNVASFSNAFINSNVEEVILDDMPDTFKYLGGTFDGCNNLNKIKMTGGAIELHIDNQKVKSIEITADTIRIDSIYCSSLNELKLYGPLSDIDESLPVVEGVANTGILYYDNKYDYTDLIIRLPSGWKTQYNEPCGGWTPPQQGGGSSGGYGGY